MVKMKLELVPVPVADVDRAIAFYVEQVGFHLDLDVRPPGNGVRIVQLTPAGSACSIVIGTGLGEISDDFDALSLWINRRQTSPASLSRGEFGAIAVPRILQLLTRYGIPSTWFIPGHSSETYRTHCEQVGKAGHEVGLHGYLHETVGALSEQQERDVFRRAFDLVANLTGQPPQGSRTPSWDLTASTVDIMLELGLLYDSSLMSHDYTPFYARRGDQLSAEGVMHFGEATRLVELPVSWSLERWLDELVKMGVAFARCENVARQVLSGRAYGTYRPATDGP